MTRTVVLQFLEMKDSVSKFCDEGQQGRGTTSPFFSLSDPFQINIKALFPSHSAVSQKRNKCLVPNRHLDFNTHPP